MNPATRRAFHQALDLVLDVLADEERAEPAKKQKRITVPKPLPMPNLPPEKMREIEERLDASMARAGYKKVG